MNVPCYHVTVSNDSFLFPVMSSGFKLKDFLRDEETLSLFLHRNASLSHHAVKHIVEADVNLEKVRRRLASSPWRPLEPAWL